MKFWLACFGLLFIGAELFQWVVQISWQPSGSWLILGGIGLAIASNAAHLPKRRSPATEGSTDTPQANLPTASAALASIGQAIATPHCDPAQPTESPSEPDSISFKVRLPWR